MISAVLDLERADLSYALDSARNPPFLSQYWRDMVKAVQDRKGLPPK